MRIIGLKVILAIALVFLAIVPCSYANTPKLKDNIHEISTDKSHDSCEQKTFWARTTCDPVALYTLLLTIFTAVLGISTIGLWLTTRKMAVTQTNDMKSSIEVAEKSAQAAILNAQTSIRTEVAYVWPQAPSVIDIFPTGADLMYVNSIPLTTRPFVRCGFGNFGRTPAIIKKIKGELILCEELPDERKFNPGANAYRTDVIIPSGNSSDLLAFSMDRPLTAQEIKDFWEKKIRFFFYGYVKFTDIFEHLHTVHYCFVIEASKWIDGKIYVGRTGGKNYNYTMLENYPENDSELGV